MLIFSSHFPHILTVFPHIFLTFWFFSSHFCVRKMWGKCLRNNGFIWNMINFGTESFDYQNNANIDAKNTVFAPIESSEWELVIGAKTNDFGSISRKIWLFQRDAMNIPEAFCSKKILSEAVRAVRLDFPHISCVRKMWGKMSIMSVPLLYAGNILRARKLK